MKKITVTDIFLASVRAFSFLHKVHFGGLPETVRPDLDPDHSEEDNDDADSGKRAQRNPHLSTANAPQDYTDSDSPEDADGLYKGFQSLKKACWPSTNRVGDVPPADTAASPFAAGAVGSLTPPPATLYLPCC